MMDHCQIIRRSLKGKRVVDEETSASLAVLADRLERVKRLGNAFSSIEFSSDIERLKSRADVVPIG
jgi:hypothetical protein